LNFFDKAIRRGYELNLNYITENCFKHLSNAYKIYDDYKKMICNLMKKYNFCTESEIFFNIRIFKNNRGYRGKSDSYNLDLKSIINDIYNEIYEIFKYINIDVASAIYVASYINLKNVYEKKVFFTNNYKENIAKLMSLFEKEKNDLKGLFKNYLDYAYLKRNHKGEYKNKYKRIFSLPWIIKEIRDLLLKLN
jgi:hypothetical protein